MGRGPEPRPTSVGRLIGTYRRQAGLSINALARATGLNPGVVHRIEHGAIVRPTPQKLARLAEALACPLADLYAAAGYAAPAELPSFHPYLRAKYGQLPPDALRKLERYFEQVRAEYGASTPGPIGREDETDHPHA